MVGRNRRFRTNEMFQRGGGSSHSLGDVVQVDVEPILQPIEDVLHVQIEELATEYDGKVKVGKLDTDNNRNTAVKFGISAIPTVILFQGGEVAKKFVGLTAKKDLKAALDEAG